MEGINAYTRILGVETFIPLPEVDKPAEEVVMETQSAQPVSTPLDWKPELKKVVEVKDRNGKHNIIDAENWKPTQTSELSNQPEQKPKQQDDRPLDRPYGDSAMLLRATIDESQGQHSNRLEIKLEIQSRRLRQLFWQLAKPYTELKLTNNPIVIEFPFRCLFFLLPEFEDQYNRQETPEEVKHELQPLLGFIKDTPWVRRHLKEYKDLVEGHNQITFGLFWMLFPPNTAAVMASSEEECGVGGVGYIVQSIDLKAGGYDDYWELNLLFGHHDGKEFSIRSTTRTIQHFHGRKRITLDDLSIVPLRVLSQEKHREIFNEFVGRGKRYIKYCEAEMSVLQYKGYVTLPESETTKRLGDWGSNRALRVEIDERVVVDRTAQEATAGLPKETEGSTRIANNFTEHLNSMRGEDISRSRTPMPRRFRRYDHVRGQDLEGLGFWTPGSYPGWDDDDDDNNHEDEPREASRDLTSAQPVKSSLTDNDYFMCQSTITAFALGQKLWVSNLMVARLSKIEWHGDPFAMLQLSQSTKSLIMKLVTGFNARTRQQEAYDDVIKGKGKGLIFLLHGPPGLGKTLTAESVAESAERPLYRITTGELNTDVQKLENQLTDIFRLCARWRALVLLDEADVLMTQRTVTDLKRNAIVAVFLRMLEYYRGILFLTTNRISDFDEAFHSRIHVTLEYGSLAPEWRKNIWREHIHRASGGNTISVDDLWNDGMFVALGLIDTNGRNIKNHVRTAYALARAGDEDLELKHVLEVLDNTLAEPKTESECEVRKNALARLRSLSKANVISPKQDREKAA